MPESLTLLERDILAHLGTALCVVPERALCLPLVETKIDVEIWATQGTVGRAVGLASSDAPQGFSLIPTSETAPHPHNSTKGLTRSGNTLSKIFRDVLCMVNPHYLASFRSV